MKNGTTAPLHRYARDGASWTGAIDALLNSLAAIIGAEKIILSQQAESDGIAPGADDPPIFAWAKGTAASDRLVPHVLPLAWPAHPADRSITAFYRPGEMVPANVGPAARPLLDALSQLLDLRRETDDRGSFDLGLVDALNFCTFGMCILGADDRIRFANKAANDLLASGDGVCRLGDHLGGNSLSDTLRLREAIQAASLSRAASSTLVAMPRKRLPPIMVTVICGDEGLARGGERTTVVSLIDPLAEVAQIPAVCKLHGLTRTEALVAAKLLQGFTVAQVSRALDLKISTVRSYLKDMYSKLGCSSQAGLVIALLRQSSLICGSHGSDVVSYTVR
jgi:DNA-binding CsgD family transcriptional regulator